MSVPIPMRWRDVPGGVRVVLPTGRIAHVLDRVVGAPGAVVLRNASGQTRGITVDPDATVPVLFDEYELAVASLKARFPNVEFLREL